MANVTININGRDYNVACGEGQESEVIRLASYINQKSKTLDGLGYIGEHLHLVMTALILADEISELRGDVEEMQTGVVGGARELEDALDELAVAQEEIANREIEIKETNAELSVANKAIDSLKEQMRELAERNIELENEHKENTKKNQAMKDSLKEFSKKVDSITERISKLK